MSMPEDDAQLPLKKRARRRLVGAVALAVLAAVVLPMVMDQAPQTPVADVQIRIPGQEQVPPFRPAVAAKPAEASPAPVAQADKPATAAPQEKPSPAAKPADTPPPSEKATKPAEKPAQKAAEKPAEKAPEKPAAKEDSQRAAAILAGKPTESAKPGPAANGEYVVLIGAFANPANVKQLQGKLGELNIKVYTEILDSPQGKKTRVRAGPFPSRDAAEKALEKMKRIGVNGVVAAKQ